MLTLLIAALITAVPIFTGYSILPVSVDRKNRGAKNWIHKIQMPAKSAYVDQVQDWFSVLCQELMDQQNRWFLGLFLGLIVAVPATFIAGPDVTNQVYANILVAIPIALGTRLYQFFEPQLDRRGHALEFWVATMVRGLEVPLYLEAEARRMVTDPKHDKWARQKLDSTVPSKDDRVEVIKQFMSEWSSDHGARRYRWIKKQALRIDAKHA